MVKDQKQKMRNFIFFKLTRQLKNKESNMFFCSKIEKSKNFENSHENTQKTSYKMSLSSCEDQRTDNSERRRKLFFVCLLSSLLVDQRTDNSERRRKPFLVIFSIDFTLLNQRTDNSERRRKPTFFSSLISQALIREQITPKGDGNFKKNLLASNLYYQRTDNSERRRKQMEIQLINLL